MNIMTALFDQDEVTRSLIAAKFDGSQKYLTDFVCTMYKVRFTIVSR